MSDLMKFTMDFFGLKNKVVLVTGGNTGLGQAYAVACAEAGADLFITTRDERDWDETRALIEAKGRNVCFYAVDLTDKDAAQNVVDACLARYQRLDVLINNAADWLIRWWRGGCRTWTSTTLPHGRPSPP